MIHTKAIPHDRGIITATPGVAYNTHTPHREITAINPALTPHTELITDHPHIEVLQLTTPEIIVDHDHVHPTNPQGEICIGHTHTPADDKADHTQRRT